MIYVNEKNFAEEIETAKGAVIADFWAEWCMPCKMMAPVFEALSAEEPDVKFCKINVDETPALAVRFGIDSIPAFVMFRDGKVIGKTVGYQDEGKLKAFLEANL